MYLFIYIYIRIYIHLCIDTKIIKVYVPTMLEAPEAAPNSDFSNSRQGGHSTSDDHQAPRVEGQEFPPGWWTAGSMVTMAISIKNC